MHRRMLNANQIKPNTPVVCSQDGQFGIVDHMEGADSIKLKKDAHGQHHYIPLSWVKNIDDKIHVDRPGAQAMQEWTTASTLPAKPEAKTAKASGAPAKPGAASVTTDNDATEKFDHATDIAMPTGSTKKSV